MNRVAARSTIALMLVVVLLGGMCLFSVEYLAKSDDWVIFQGNPHVYNGVNIGCGVITDRSGILLLDSTDGRTYASDGSIRKSTIHWLGDRYGYISAPAVTAYASEMAGYDLLNGLYGYGGTGGSAELTISAEVQKVAMEALGKKKGVVAVYNYKTGEILCAVSAPNYDPDNVPNIDDSSKYEGIYLNRFTQTAYIPGSVFKLVTTAAAGYSSSVISVPSGVLPVAYSALTASSAEAILLPFAATRHSYASEVSSQFLERSMP